MAFPTTSVIENFTGTNGANLDSDWSTLTGVGAAAPLILSNAASNVSAFNPYIGAYWDVTTFGPDSEAFMTITEDGSYFGVFCRITNPTGSTNGYKAGWSDDAGGTVTLERITATSSFTIDTATVAGPDVGDKLGIEAIGSTIKAYVDTGSGWTEVCSVTDTNHSGAGYIGFDAYDPTAISLDDFGGGTVVGGGTDATVTAVPSTALADAPLGVVTASSASTVTAVPALAAADAPLGAVTAGATVAGVPATALADAPPANQMISSVVTAPAISILASAPAGVIATAGDATVTGVPSVALADAPSGVLFADADVTGIPSDCAAGAPAGVLTASGVVSGVPSDAAAQAPRPTLSPAPEGGGSLTTLTTTFAEDFA